MATSIFSPVDPAKVFKAPSKRRSPHQKTNVSCGALQTVKKRLSIPALRSREANRCSRSKTRRPLLSALFIHQKFPSPAQNGQLDYVEMIIWARHRFHQRTEKQCSSLLTHRYGEAHEYQSSLRNFVLAMHENQLWHFLK